jgi:integrase/recombinase XerC
MPESLFLTYLEKEKRYSSHTLTAYRKDLEQLKLFLSQDFDTDLINCSSVMLRSWVVSLMEKGLNEKSVNRKVSTIKSFFTFALKEGFVQKNPTLKLIAPKVKKPLPAFFKTTEMNALFEDFHFEDDFGGKRDALLIDILYSCGIRLSELIGIKDADVSLPNGTIKVLGKRNKERIVPIHRSLINKLKDYQELKRELYSEAHLLLTDKGEMLYPKFVYRKVNYYLSKVTSSSKKSPHILRHTFATHMLNNGADLNTIKELLGHANLSATEVYTHNSIEKLKNVYNQAHPRA